MMDENIFKVGVLEIKYFLMVKFFNDIWYKNCYGYFIDFDWLIKYNYIVLFVFWFWCLNNFLYEFILVSL